MTRFVPSWLLLAGVALLPTHAQQVLLDARDDRATCGRNSSTTIDVLANDVLEPFGVNITDVTDPAHGQLLEGQLPGQFIFLPDDGFVGTTSFRYTLTAAQGGASDTATVTILVLDAANLIGGFVAAEQLCDADSNICTITAIAAVANNGTACGCAVAAEVFLSDDPKLDAKDRTVARFLTGPVGPDQVFEKRISKRLKPNQSAAGKFLIIKLDVTNRLLELNERDNLGDAQIGPFPDVCHESPARLLNGRLTVRCGEVTRVITRY